MLEVEVTRTAKHAVEGGGNTFDWLWGEKVIHHRFDIWDVFWRQTANDIRSILKNHSRTESSWRFLLDGEESLSSPTANINDEWPFFLGLNFIPE